MFVRDELRNYLNNLDEIFTVCVIWSNLINRIVHYSLQSLFFELHDFKFYNSYMIKIHELSIWVITLVWHNGQ